MVLNLQRAKRITNQNQGREPLFGKYFISRRAPKWFVPGRFQSHVTICVQKIASRERRKKCCPMNFRWQNKESLPEFIAADHCQQYPSLCWPDHYLAKVIRKQKDKAGCDTWLRMQIQVLGSPREKTFPECKCTKMISWVWETKNSMCVASHLVHADQRYGTTRRRINWVCVRAREERIRHPPPLNANVIIINKCAGHQTLSDKIE